MNSYQNKTKKQLIARIIELEKKLNSKESSESIQAEDAINIEKSFTQIALDAQLDTFFLFEPATGKAIRWNKAFREISGYTNDEIASMPAPDSYYSQEDLKRAKEFTMNVNKAGAGTIELELICKNGKKIPTEYRVAAINDMQGNPKYFISIGRDITERKQVENELSMSQEQFVSFINSASDSFYLLDSKLNFIEINRRGLEIIGKKREDVIGKNIKEIVPDVEESGRYQKHLEVMRTGKPFMIDHFVPHPVFGDLHFMLKSFKVGDGLGVIAIDITEREKARKMLTEQLKFETLITDLSAGFIHIPTENIDQEIENALKKIVESIGVGRSVIMQFPTDESEMRFTHTYSDPKIKAFPDEANINKHFKYGATKILLGDIFKFSNLDELPKEANPLRQYCEQQDIKSVIAVPLSAGGVLMGSLSISMFHTERTWSDDFVKRFKLLGEIISNVLIRKRNHVELQKREEQLRQSEKIQAIGQLAGGIAHDFNNQLAGIQSFTELIKSYALENSKLNYYAENILTIVQRSTGLTRQLLAFSRKGKYQEVKVDIHNIINEVISILERSIDKRIELKKHTQAYLPFTKGDPSQLQNVILNLVLNARDAIENAGEIEITTENTRLNNMDIKNRELSIKPGDYIKICVHDTGKGMDDKTLIHIFEPFFTTKAPGTGTGMGLAAVYGTINNHKGGILADSEPGKGTTITIYLPVVEASELPRTKEEKALLKKGKASILFIDDEEMITVSAKIILNVLGYKVNTCKNGKEAVQFYEENWKDIDLVILDMIMPEMNGKEAFNKMKKVNPKINALMLSGYCMDKKIREALDMGIKGFIEKPFTKEVLTEKIAEVLDK